MVFKLINGRNYKQVIKIVVNNNTITKYTKMKNIEKAANLII